MAGDSPRSSVFSLRDPAVRVIPQETRAIRRLSLITSKAHRMATYTGYEKRCIDALKDSVPELGPELEELA